MLLDDYATISLCVPIWDFDDDGVCLTQNPLKVFHWVHVW